MIFFCRGNIFLIIYTLIAYNINFLHYIIIVIIIMMILNFKHYLAIRFSFVSKYLIGRFKKDIIL